MKPFRTIDEQISILKERGLNIAAEAKAKTILSKENYYNLINGYKRLFVNDSEENEVYKEGCSFEYSTHSEPHRPALRATYSII